MKRLTVFIGGLLEEIVCVVEDVRAATGMYTMKDTWAFNDYDLLFTDNSTISAFKFNKTEIQISFNVTGHTGTTGFCNLIIPKVLILGNP